MATWHGADLDGVLNDLTMEADRLRAECPKNGFPPFYPGGYTEAEIDDAERKCDKEVPQPVRKLLRSVRGVPGEIWGRSEYRETMFLIQSPFAEWWSCPGDFEDPDPKWHGVRHFSFAQSVLGDSIVYCSNPPGRTPGSIIIEDHEMTNNMPSEVEGMYTPTVFLASSLAEWLARWMACNYCEYGIMFGGAWGISHALEREFLEDHIRLNPRVEWARRRLAWMDKEDSVPMGSAAQLLPCMDCGKQLYLGTMLEHSSNYQKQHDYICGHCPACDGSFRCRCVNDKIILGAVGETNKFEPVSYYDQPGMRAKKRWKRFEVVLDGFKWTFRDYDPPRKQRI